MAKVDADYLKQIEAARNELRNIIRSQNCAPIMLRLAFHDAGTFDAKTKTGGPNGTIRLELSSPPNNGIKVAVDLCEPVKAKHPKITYADIYQDAPQQDSTAGLPNPGGDAEHLRDVFHRMGLSDRDIVALSGSHTLGRAHQDRSGFDGPFTPEPLKFDNSYYVELRKGESPGLVKFPSDKVLTQDPVFRKYVQIYAQDEKTFFAHYAESHKKMSELGFRPPVKA
ncbi:hypothetical protein KSS87_017808 [Heliosperma pusillum]|nr:hypothetical protein KSS87_017808 [Heliosperma pusillum]